VPYRGWILVNIFKIKFFNLNLSLKYPSYPVRLKNEGTHTLIFDFIRKKWLRLTPEEWVRQHLLNFLVTEKKYPASCLAIEKELELNGLRRRYDVVIFDQRMNPFLIAECKAPYVRLDQVVLEQVLRYNLSIQAPFVLVTNGVSDAVFNRSNLAVELPEYGIQVS